MKSVRSIVKKMDPNLSESDAPFAPAMVLVAASQVGTGADNIARRAGLSRAKVRPIVRECRRTGVFKGREIAHGGWFGKDGGIAFWMDVAVVQGLLERVHS